eukprot:78317_1
MKPITTIQNVTTITTRRRKKAVPQYQPQPEKPNTDLFGCSDFEDFYLCNVASPSARNIDSDQSDAFLSSAYFQDINNRVPNPFVSNLTVPKVMLFHSDSNASDDLVAFNELQLDLELGLPTTGAPGKLNISQSRSFGSTCSSSVSPRAPRASPDLTSQSTKTSQDRPQLYSPYSSVDIRSIIDSKLEIYELVEFRLVYRLMRDQFGSRYLQKLIKSLSATHRGSTNHISMLISHLITESVDLCLMSEDIYGNYLIQLFFVHGNDSHHELLLNNFVYKNTLRLCKSNYGCRVIQKILSTVKSVDRLIQLVQCFEKQTIGNIQRCLLFCNTNHVIQAMIGLKLPFEHLDFIKDALERKLVDYSDNVYACRVVQAFIKVYGNRLDVSKLRVNDQHLLLARSKYGNYVIQCIVAKDEWYCNLPMIKKFRNELISDVIAPRNILFLSKNKFGSNVIETAIKVSNEKQLDILINTICAKQGALLKQMIFDKFANYVPKTLLDNCRSDRQIMKLVNTVHLHIVNLYMRHGYWNCSGFIQKCQHIINCMK